MGKIADPLNFFGGNPPAGPAPLALSPEPVPPESNLTEPDLEIFTRPDEIMSLPTFLGISSSMSPTQQLSRIATLGTQGSFGDIRSPTEGDYAGQGAADVARDYFQNLMLRTFTDDTGAPLNDMGLLPIYEQYLSQSLGQPPVEGGDSLAHFLTRLTRI